MKKLISTFVFVVGFVAISLAQDASNTAMTSGADALMKSKASGAYVYTLPENVTNDQVGQAAQYYTQYFTVDFDDASNEATLTMMNEKDSNRAVMVRFLSACGVKYVTIDGSDLNLQEFMEQHLQ